jgi:hypothetical protein
MKLFPFDFRNARRCGLGRFWTSFHFIILQKKRQPKGNFGQADTRPAPAVSDADARCIPFNFGSVFTDGDGNS